MVLMMLARIWKKLGLFILIVACLFNIVSKLTTRVTFSDEITASTEYVREVVVNSFTQGQDKSSK